MKLFLEDSNFTATEESIFDSYSRTEMHKIIKYTNLYYIKAAVK